MSGDRLNSKMTKRMLTIDPGFHTGLALWDGDLEPRIDSINVSSKKSIKTLEDKLDDMWMKFEGYLADNILDIELVVIEGVETWSGSSKSKVASTTGSLSKLSYLIGGYCQLCREYGIAFKIISVRDWKGNLPKEVVEKRVISKCNLTYTKGKITDHIYDAVGIGLAMMGKL